MADEQNTKCEKFNSRSPHRLAAAADCFTQDWSSEKNYVCAPFNLIDRVLAHIRECEAEALVVVPVWPGRPWWPLLLAMLAGPKEVALFRLPQGPASFRAGPSGRVEPQRRGWRNFAVAHVSGATLSSR